MPLLPSARRGRAQGHEQRDLERRREHQGGRGPDSRDHPPVEAAQGRAVYAVIGVPAQAAIHHKDAIIKAAREVGGLRDALLGTVQRRVRPRHARRRPRHRHRRRHDGQQYGTERVG